MRYGDDTSYFEAFLELARTMEKNNYDEADKITAAIIAVGFSRAMHESPVKAEAALQSLRDVVESSLSDCIPTLQ